MSQSTMTSVRARAAGDRWEGDLTRRLLASAALTTEDPGSRIAPGTFHDWFAEQARAHRYVTSRVGFPALSGWRFAPGTGNLEHESGRFFTVEGLRVHRDGGPVESWTQPVIVQPEIGVLGILMKEFGGVLYCLMQAKMEPGNIGPLQLSPTVQATRSNYTGVHRGRRVPYLEYFTESGRGRVLTDVLQSEQGAWFLHKRNRNVVVVTDEDVPVLDGFRWMTLGRLGRLLHADNLVNMDARTVLASLPLTAAGELPGTADDAFTAALRRSMDPAAGTVHSMTEILSWLTAARSRRELRQERIPLAETARDGWTTESEVIRHRDGEYFSVIAVDVRAGNREVSRWGQPLLAPAARGFAGLLTARIGGVLHVLLQAQVESGTLNVAEVGPTVMCLPEAGPDTPDEHRPPFWDLVLSAPPRSRRLDVVLSEEGGRFFHAVTRYVIVDAGDGPLPDVPRDHCWIAVHQAAELLRHSNYVNVQARTLLACLSTLWPTGRA